MNKIPPDKLNPLFFINLTSITDKLRLLTIIIPFKALLLNNMTDSNKTVNGILNRES